MKKYTKHPLIVRMEESARPILDTTIVAAILER